MFQNVFFFLKNKSEVKFLYDNVSVLEGLKLFHQHGYTATPVIDTNGVYQGTITEGDFLWYLLNHQDVSNDDFQLIEIKELIRKDFMPAVDINTDMGSIFKQSLEQNFVPIVDDRNIFIGIVTRKSIIEYLLTLNPNTEIQIPNTNKKENIKVF